MSMPSELRIQKTVLVIKLKSINEFSLKKKSSFTKESNPTVKNNKIKFPLNNLHLYT
jgi:hypothetical protein